MNAFESLVLAAQLAGVSVAPIKAPVLPTEIARYALADVVAAQDSACKVVSGLRVCAAFGTDYETWIKVSQGGATLAFPESKLRQGADAFGKRLSYARGVLAVGAEDVEMIELLASIYAKAKRIRLGVVDYAVLYEDGALVPRSATFVRKDPEDGQFYIAWRPAAELQTYEWLLAVNGIMYGPRLEGAEMGFYSKPVPNIPQPQFFGALRITPDL